MNVVNLTILFLFTIFITFINLKCHYALFESKNYWTNEEYQDAFRDKYDKALLCTLGNLPPPTGACSGDSCGPLYDMEKDSMISYQ